MKKETMPFMYYTAEPYTDEMEREDEETFRSDIAQLMSQQIENVLTDPLADVRDEAKVKTGILAKSSEDLLETTVPATDYQDEEDIDNSKQAEVSIAADTQDGQDLDEEIDEGDAQFEEEELLQGAEVEDMDEYEPDSDEEGDEEGEEEEGEYRSTDMAAKTDAKDSSTNTKSTEVSLDSLMEMSTPDAHMETVASAQVYKNAGSKSEHKRDVDTPLKERPLLVDVVVAQNILNGYKITRPDVIAPTDDYSLSYAFLEVESPEQAAKLHSQIRERKRIGMDFDRRFGDDFMRQLRELSKSGEAYALEQEKIDARSDIVVYKPRTSV
jgi:hypothetical protein